MPRNAPSKKKSRKRRDYETFRCRRCGRCCTGNGYVTVEKDECEKIAEFLGISLERFLEEYTHYQAGYERWLVDGPGEDEPCVFLVRPEGGPASCRIEGEAKPVQCRTFPTKWRVPGFEKWCAAFREDDSQ